MYPVETKRADGLKVFHRTADKGTMARPTNEARACYVAEGPLWAPDRIVPLTFPEFRDLVRLVWREAGQSGEPTVVHRPRKRGATAFRDARLVEVGDGSLAAHVALHETAHLLAPSGARHGPAWRTVYVGLLSRYLSDDAATTFASGVETAAAAIRQAGAGRKRRRFVVEEAFPSGTGVATWAPSTLPARWRGRHGGSIRAAMRRGDCWQTPDGRWFRMVESRSETT
jgi:hypothetical protein